MDSHPVLQELLRKSDQTHAITIQNSADIKSITSKLDGLDGQHDLIRELVLERKARVATEMRKLEFWTDVRKKLLVGSIFAVAGAMLAALGFLIKEFVTKYWTGGAP